MLNISFLACTKVVLWDLTVCIVVNGEKLQSHAVTLILFRQCPISNLSELFSYTATYLNFMFLDRFLFELSCKNTETRKHGKTETHTDSDEYSIVALCKNVTIKTISEWIITYFGIQCRKYNRPKG